MIKNFTNKFLTYTPVTLFILFIMDAFNMYSSDMPALDYITTAVNLIGIISFLSWVYAIGYKTNEKLKNKNIKLTIFKYFNFGFMAMIASGVIMYILLITQDEVNITEKSGN